MKISPIKDNPIYDWGMLIGTALVPVVLFGFGLINNIQTEAKSKKQEESTVRRAEATRQHEVMTNYLSSMTNLMLRHKLLESEKDSKERTAARAITLNTARRLDGEGRGQLLKFLYEAKLVGHCPPVPIDGSIARDKCTPPVFKLNTAKFETAVLGDSPMPPLTGINLDNSVLNNANLPRIPLPGASLKQAKLTDADLSEADLKDADMSGAILTGASLQKAFLTRATLNGARMSGASLQCAHLNGARLVGPELQDSQLDYADLDWATLESSSKSKIENVSLREAILTNVNLSKVDLKTIDVTGAIYNRRTTLPTGYTFEQLKMQPESTRDSSLANRKQKCDQFQVIKKASAQTAAQGS